MVLFKCQKHPHRIAQAPNKIAKLVLQAMAIQKELIHADSDGGWKEKAENILIIQQPPGVNPLRMSRSVS